MAVDLDHLAKTGARRTVRLLCRAALLGSAAGCSVFPAPNMPHSIVESVRAEYAFPVGAPRTIQVPASGEDMTVLELVVEPQPRAERFERGRRILILPFDCTHAALRCRVQRWARGDDDDLLAPVGNELFPGASSVRFVDEPQP